MQGFARVTDTARVPGPRLGKAFGAVDMASDDGGPGTLTGKADFSNKSKRGQPWDFQYRESLAKKTDSLKALGIDATIDTDQDGITDLNEVCTAR